MALLERRGYGEKASMDSKFLKGVGNILSSIELSEIDEQSDAVIRLKNYEFLASYNWANVKEPTIYVPGLCPLFDLCIPLYLTAIVGAPAAWTPPDLPIRILPDRGTFYVDQNTHRSPKSSFQPLFHSLLMLHPSFKMTPISLVTDRNNLRKLFGFASGRIDRSFRIDVELIEDTLFFVRWELNVLDIIRGSKAFGFGHGFERAVTAFGEGLGDSSGHHRIVKYNLGGLQCLVRFEADAYTEDSEDTKGQSIPKEDDDQSNLSTVLESLSLSSKSTSLKTCFTVLPRGQLIPTTAVVEIKSRKKRVRMADTIPQLYFSQTEKLFVGYHEQGVFTQDIEKLEMRASLDDWETDHQPELRKLLRLISKIREVLQMTGKKKVVVVCDNKERPRKLRIYKSRNSSSVVDRDVLENCWG
jgi:hypothetical protein